MNVKSHTDVSKVRRKDNGDSSQRSSCGENAVAMTPPDYGIDFVDNGMAAVAPVQRMGELEDEELNPIQGKFDAAPMQLQQGPTEPTPNRTGMPDQLKAGIESLSGIAMSGVRVHYNSSKPAQLNALAYAQGNDIHLGSGQEKHLPHEAWHVVQQKQGRVKPTLQMKGQVNVNDDIGLEKEAGVMGERALQGKGEVSGGLVKGSDPYNVVQYCSDLKQRLAALPSVTQDLLFEAFHKSTVDEAVKQIFNNTFERTDWKYCASNKNTKGETYIDGTSKIGMCQSFREAFKEILTIFDDLRRYAPKEYGPGLRDGELKIEDGQDLVETKFYTKPGLELIGSDIKGNMYYVDDKGEEQELHCFVFSAHWTLKVNGKEYDPIFHTIDQDNVEGITNKMYESETYTFLANKDRPTNGGEFQTTFLRLPTEQYQADEKMFNNAVSAILEVHEQKGKFRWEKKCKKTIETIIDKNATFLRYHKLMYGMGKIKYADNKKIKEVIEASGIKMVAGSGLEW